MLRDRRCLAWVVLLAALSPCFAAVNFPVEKSAYVVANPESPLEERTLGQLTTYLAAVLRRDAKVVQTLRAVPASTAAIVLVLASQKNPLNVNAPVGAPEGFGLMTGESGGRSLVVAVGNTDRGLKRAVQKLILKSQQGQGGLTIPDLNLSEKPWIPAREWTLCPWVPWNVRGVYVNPYADERVNLYEFTDAQLAKYVEMFDWFGFSGAQLIDSANSWSYFGSVESYQEQLKKLSRLAHANGQQVTLWVWAAEFNHYGWTDTSLTYTPEPGHTAFDDPAVRSGFEKYYNYYAELAPYADRLIGHFYDPGELTNRDDVFKYMRLLETKFKASNPQIKPSIDLWGTDPGYFNELVKNGFKDYLLLEMSIQDYVPPALRAKVHEAAKQLGIHLGMWGWYDTEYETDQQPSLYVNGKMFKDFAQQIKNGAEKIQPLEYWSEMEADHINNMCSMYLAGQLLWNPDRDPDEIMAEFADGVWGPQNGPRVLEAFKLIQDVRSGPNWNTYWWTMPGYRRGTADPKEDLRRVELTLADLQSLKIDRTFVPKFPLPVAPDVMVELMLPHLRQIRAFAEFRIELDEIRAAWKKGASREDISQRLAKAWKPIPEYNTWVGAFGQTESRMQEILLRKFAKEAGVDLVEPAWFRARDADRMLQKIQNVQREQRRELDFKVGDLDEFSWTKEKLQSRLDKLIADGWVEKAGDDTYRLVNWPHYAAQ